MDQPEGGAGRKLWSPENYYKNDIKRYHVQCLKESEKILQQSRLLSMEIDNIT